MLTNSCFGLIFITNSLETISTEVPMVPCRILILFMTSIIEVL